MTDRPLTIDRSYRDGAAAPLYCRYPHETMAQPAYIALDECGTVSAGYSPEIGNAVGADVWAGRTRRYEVPADISITGLEDLLGEDGVDSLIPLLRRVCAGLSVEWDGSNQVGTLSDDAAAAEDEITLRLRDGAEVDRASVMRVEDYLYDTQPKDLKQGATSWAEITIQDIEDSLGGTDVDMIDGDIESEIDRRAARAAR